MRDELELKLAEEFPFMQEKKTLQEQKTEGRISDLYSAFGCEVGDGWYELLHDTRPSMHLIFLVGRVCVSVRKKAVYKKKLRMPCVKPKGVPKPCVKHAENRELCEKT